jgi:P-type E1-E2 ATPase
MISRDSENVKIQINGIFEEYKIIKVFEFTSDRKMMSVIVKRVPDNRFFIFTKGADEKLLPLAINQQQVSGEVSNLRKNVDNYARQGHRTLVFAMRELK